ncbi:MAG: L-seryl-tRNA(Sec) selenium transferase, partial [Armatimonadota bacterium]|nr:L-seryl-tRNA(Sec) selenium transferase [Armatimonadota bacterium]
TALPSWAVRLKAEGMSADEVASRLRSSTPPVLARIQDGAVLLDLRSVLPEDDAVLEDSVAGALSFGF